MSDHTPQDWFWIVGGDASRAWSSKSGAYVQTWPAERVTRILNEAELCDVLAVYGMRGPGYVPKSVKMWQAKAALAASGKLDAANAVVSGSGTPALTIAWEYATDVSRDSPGLLAVAAALKLSSADIDALFLAAENIKV